MNLYCPQHVSCSEVPLCSHLGRRLGSKFPYPLRQPGGWRSTTVIYNHIEDIHELYKISNHAHVIKSAAGVRQLEPEVFDVLQLPEARPQGRDQDKQHHPVPHGRLFLMKILLTTGIVHKHCH